MSDDFDRPAPHCRARSAGAAYDEDSEESRGNRLMMLFWSGIWLFWMYQPFGDAIHRVGTVRGIVGIVTVPVFCALYLWHFYACRAAFFRLAHPGALRLRARDVVRYFVLGLLALACIFAVGQSGFTAAIFFALSGLWTLRLKLAWLIVVAVGICYAALWRLPGWQPEPSAYIGLGFGAIAISVGMTAGRRQHQLRESRRVNADLMVQQERNRMARDLHDILGHSLTVITVKSELAGRLLDAGAGERARAEVADLERLARTALSDVRRAVEGYREISLSGELARAKEALAAAGITATTPTALDQVPADLVEPFAWTVRECVTNVLRHSRATTCTISVTPASITIADNGVGVGAGKGSGNGLAGLRERASAAGAVVITRSVEPHGFSVTVSARVEGSAAVPSADAAAAAARHTAGRASGEALA